MTKRLAWGGVSGVYYIGHGIGAEPEIEYQGHRFDYWEVENALADLVDNDLDLDWDTEISADDWFSWIKNNHETIRGLLAEWLVTGRALLD